MSDNQAQPPGGPQPNDPWAPPESGGAAGKVPMDKPAATPPPGVHDQPTVISMPGADDPGSVPPPPVAPGGPAPGQPAAGAYGYPAAPSLPQPPAAGAPGYGAPDPYGPGYPGYPGYGQAAAGWQQQPANGMGITAMVLGILSVCLFCLYGIVAIILGVLALIFGILGRKRAQRGEATNGGMALAGIILGVCGIVIGAVVIALIAWGITTAINEENKRDSYDYDYDSYSNHLVVDVTR